MDPSLHLPNQAPQPHHQGNILVRTALAIGLAVSGAAALSEVASADHDSCQPGDLTYEGHDQWNNEVTLSCPTPTTPSPNTTPTTSRPPRTTPPATQPPTNPATVPPTTSTVAPTTTSTTELSTTTTTELPATTTTVEEYPPVIITGNSISGISHNLPSSNAGEIATKIAVGVGLLGGTGLLVAGARRRRPSRAEQKHPGSGHLAGARGGGGA